MMVVSMFTALPMMAQTTDDAARHEAQMKKLKKGLNEKAVKAARKEVKRLEKNGWETAPGTLPMDKQLERSYLYQEQLDDNMEPAYITVTVTAIGENYIAAKKQAEAILKPTLAGKIQSNVTEIIENTVSTKQLAPGEAASVVQTLSQSKEIISQELGSMITIVDLFRTLKNGNKEVSVTCAYSMAKAKQVAKDVVKKELEKGNSDLQKKWDDIEL